MVLILFAGCQKEKDAPKTNEYYITNKPIDDLIGLNKRTGESEFDKMLLWSAKSILNLYRNDNNMLYDIVTQATNSEDNSFPFSELSQDYLQAINNYLRSEYKVNLSYIINHMIFDSIPYYPNIMIPNAADCNPNLNPIIVIGTEAYLDSTFNNHGDFVAGWGINNNNINTILINEQQANNTNRPVVIINNGTDYVKSVDAGAVSTGVVSGHGGGGSGGGGGGSSIDYRKFYFTSFRINYRYEKTGDSEFAINYIVNKCNGTNVAINNYVMKKVDKNDIGTPIGIHIPAFEYIPGPCYVYHIYGFTYEYDWYASKKLLEVVHDYAIECKMTNLNEYYQKIDLSLYNISNNQFVQVNGKGYIKIARIDP